MSRWRRRVFNGGACACSSDANDGAANAIIQKLFPDKTVVGIDVRNLYAEGGMVHCVTQPQPW
ncbi:agmatine deiminase family protein [Myxococcus stipitatus]|uniref:agmatine deiminase family protein n=1 Tax=Myxococcus stipitatus TaxID=83455 RepID=UPI0030D42322